jgi:hypothetical protein
MGSKRLRRENPLVPRRVPQGRLKVFWGKTQALPFRNIPSLRILDPLTESGARSR